jgi:hypothetical protein
MHCPFSLVFLISCYYSAWQFVLVWSFFIAGEMDHFKAGFGRHELWGIGEKTK